MAAIGALAACASKPVATTVRLPALTGPLISLHPAPGPSAFSSVEQRASAIEFVNARRIELGLPAVTADAQVAAAAADHARYLENNHAQGHDEVEGSPGFTGIDVTTRVRVHTPAWGATEVLAVYGGPSAPPSPIEEIFNSPYHRGAVLYDWARAGEASVSGASAITVVDFADLAPAITDTELVAYPYDGQRDAPFAWTDDEQPDPLGPSGSYRGQTVGIPISLSGGPNAHIELDSVDLRDWRGQKVKCQIAALTPADARRNTGICTPLEPLRPARRYSVEAVGRLSQYGFANAPFRLHWSFMTRDSVQRFAAESRAGSGN